MATINMQKPCNDKFYRIAKDRHYVYEDMSEDVLKYPVWICDSLDVDDCHQRLANAIYKLNEKRQDCHGPSPPVQDIIDPDLLICRPDDFSTECSMTHIRPGKAYKWMPTNFVIDEKGHVKISTMIPQLERTSENEQLYNDIARIFEAMLPAFQETDILGQAALPGNTLQVIVKSQSYNLRPGMKHTSRWHLKGSANHIIAIGVYYIDVDIHLEGGALKFRPERVPHPRYSIRTDEDVPIHTGKAIVYSQKIPHRFRRIHNSSEKSARRTYLNFLIVDPQKPVDLTSYSLRVLTPLDTIISILDKASDGRLLKTTIRERIIRYLGPSAWKTIEEAKQFRTQIRKAASLEAKEHGWIVSNKHGFIQFSPCCHSTESLLHTDSE